MSTQDFNQFIQKTKNRKVLHYTLLYSVLFLLLLALFLMYNEMANDKKLTHLYQKLFQFDKVVQDINRSENELSMSQLELTSFIVNKDSEHLDGYHSKIKNLKSNLFDIRQNLLNNESAINPNELNDVNFDKLNSFIQNPEIFNPGQKSVIPKDLKSQILNKVLLNTTVEANTTVDSVQKKGFFKRLNDAVKGKSDVQVQKTDVLVTYTYGTKVQTGPLNEYVSYTVMNALNEYEKKIVGVQKINEKINDNLNAANQKLLENNDSIVHYSQKMFNQYQQSITKAKENLKLDYDKQYLANKQFRTYSLLGMLLTLLLIVGITFKLTRITYFFEEQITRAKEILQDNLRFKNRIVSMLSHEVRSPLQMISIISKRINQQNNTDEKLNKNVQAIDFTANSILLLTNQILAYSQSEQIDKKLQLTPVKLADEVQLLQQSFQPLIESKKNTLEAVNDIDPELMVQADVSKLHQLYYNILGNAVKFTQNGKIKITNQAMVSSDNTVNFKVSIQDTGTGISAEDLKLVMSPFQQGQNALQQHQNLGVGLGLYLCKEIVELYGGTLNVDSKLHEGTVVQFNIPLKKV